MLHRVRAAAPSLLLLIASFRAVASPPAPAGTLRVAAVQLEVSAADLSSLDAYASHMRRAADEAARSGAELIVFPEYTGVLVALVPYSWALQGSSTAPEALGAISARDPGIDSIEEALRRSSGFALEAMRLVFGGIAAEHGVGVIAGTYFAAAGGVDGRALRNRALVFGPDGRIVYEQDKAFLTDFEELLHLEPGDPGTARLFEVAGRKVGLTICRDTFFSVWESILSGAELWIDIKGNGELYTSAVAQKLTRALPARLRGSGVREGLTVFLTGELLDFVWEGPSSWERLEADGSVRTLRVAARARGEEVMLIDAAPSTAGGGASLQRP